MVCSKYFIPRKWHLAPPKRHLREKFRTKDKKKLYHERHVRTVIILRGGRVCGSVELHLDWFDCCVWRDVIFRGLVPSNLAGIHRKKLKVNERTNRYETIAPAVRMRNMLNTKPHKAGQLKAPAYGVFPVQISPFPLFFHGKSSMIFPIKHGKKTEVYVPCSKKQ